MSSTIGNVLKLSIFGESHSPAIGCSLNGLPAGIPIDLDALQTFLERRAPGRSKTATERNEADKPEILSGIHEGVTDGAPFAAIIRNANTRSKDYEGLRSVPRPGHADYPARIKFGNWHDVAGGGHFSGRLTAPLCIVGGIALQALDIDSRGLDQMDNKILATIIHKFGGGPVGINTIATAVSEDAGTIEEVYEPFLIKEGFLKRTPRGREVTALAYEHLGVSRGLEDGMLF